MNLDRDHWKLFEPAVDLGLLFVTDDSTYELVPDCTYEYEYLRVGCAFIIPIVIHNTLFHRSNLPHTFLDQCWCMISTMLRLR